MPDSDDDKIFDWPDSNASGLSCKTCDAHFNSTKEFNAHMQSKKHVKRVAQKKLVQQTSKMRMDEKETEETKNGDGDNDEEEEEEDSLHCDVCNKYFSGHVSYMSHLKGGVHAKYLKKQKLKEKMVGMPEVLDKDTDENSEDEDGIIQKPFARCSTCQKEFSGPESFAAHMKSSIHKKKAAVSKLDISKHQDGSKISEDESGCFAKCTVCQKSFSGPIPFHTHMLSNIHKKNLERQKVAEELKQLSEEFNPETGFVCKECKKAFIDPLMFKNHLQNNNHEKQKAKKAMTEFLDKYPDIAFVTLFDGYNPEDKPDSDDELSQDFYLICKICNMSFSGPESAKDHVKSKKHLNLQKEKRMLKLIKEQKKQSKPPVKTEAVTSPKSTGNVQNKKDVSVDVANHSTTEDDFELI